MRGRQKERGKGTQSGLAEELPGIRTFRQQDVQVNIEGFRLLYPSLPLRGEGGVRRNHMDRINEEKITICCKDAYTHKRLPIYLYGVAFLS